MFTPPLSIFSLDGCNGSCVVMGFTEYSEWYLLVIGERTCFVCVCMRVWVWMETSTRPLDSRLWLLNPLWELPCVIQTFRANLSMQAGAASFRKQQLSLSDSLHPPLCVYWCVLHMCLCVQVLLSLEGNESTQSLTCQSTSKSLYNTQPHTHSWIHTHGHMCIHTYPLRVWQDWPFIDSLDQGDSRSI